VRDTNGERVCETKRRSAQKRGSEEARKRGSEEARKRGGEEAKK
jgi:hypothetical protein